MLEALLESPVKEKVLLYLLANEDSYPNEIARNFGFNLNAVQYQLQKLEKAGVLRSRLRGKVRLYSLDPGCPFRRELEALLQNALAALDDAERGKYSLHPRPRPSAAVRPRLGAAVRPRLGAAIRPPELPAEKPELNTGAVAGNRPQPSARPAEAVRERRPARPVRRIPQRSEPLDFSTD